MKDTIIRTVAALLVAIFDLLKSVFGIDFGIDNEAVYAFVTLIVGIWVFWKNNSFTVEAKTADKLMKDMKRNKHNAVEAEEPEDNIEEEAID